MQTTALTVAAHADERLFWDGGNYELNMSFDALRDKQWQRVLQALWAHRLLYGPLITRYIPGVSVTETMIAVPPPTATQAQHGQLEVNAAAVGCDVLATRSLFECVSVLVPMGMFAGLDMNGGGAAMRERNPQLSALDHCLREIALAVYDAVPFRLAAIGWERECQVIAELRADSEQRSKLIGLGNFLGQDDVLRGLGVPVDGYELLRPNLRWAAAHV